MLIHPTALIHPSAQLGHNVEIGEYAVVRAEVTIGDDCIIQSHAVLTSHVTLGRRNLVGHGTVIGSAPQDRAFDKLLQSSVHIGDDNEIREHVTIHRGTKVGSITSVGNGNMLMTGVHLGHNVQMGHRNIIANNALFAGYVDIADDVTVGGGSVFHQFIRVGRMAMIRGGTAWSKDIPPFCVGLRINTLGGLNAIGMRRKGIDQAGRNEVKNSIRPFSAVIKMSPRLSTPSPRPSLMPDRSSSISFASAANAASVALISRIKPLPSLRKIRS